MMTADEHVAEAERLMDGLQPLLDEVDEPKSKHFSAVASVAQMAQAHAMIAMAKTGAETLALASRQLDAILAVTSERGGE